MRQLFLILLLSAFAACANPQQSKKKSINKIKKTLNTKIKLSPVDSTELANFKKTAEKTYLSKKSIPEIQIIIANRFLGKPYVGGTLDINDTEQLVINLHEFDCVTFSETVSALTLCVKSGEYTNEKYFKNLQTLRYRNGKINGYLSRLHYFTEWLLNNQAKGLIRIVSNNFGDKDFDSEVNFMSQHPKYYKQLSDSATLARIKNIEKQISSARLKMVSEENLKNVEDSIKDGDLIAIVTTKKGMDIAHVGIAEHYNGRLHFIHASSAKKKVVLSDKPLSDYIKSIKTDSGVLVARINP